VTLHGGEDQFSFLDLLPGRYAVGVNRDWNAPIEVHEVFDIGAGVIQCELRLPPLDMDQFIHVTVLRPDGGIADGVHLGFTHRSGGGRPSRWGSSPMRTQEGVYLYSVPVNSKNAYYVDPSAVDEFLISARADGYGELEVPLTPGQREITIQLVGEAILEVSVLSIAGSSLHGQFQVSVKPILEGGIEGSSSPFGKEVSSQGMVRYDGLAAQRHRVTLSTKFRRGTPGNHMQSSELMTTDVLLHSGTNLLEITAPPVYTLEVLVEGTQEIRNIYLWRASPETGEIMESVGSQNTDELGRASFDLLPAGQYVLRGLTVAEELEAFTVPCGPVTLRAKQ
jgi:hypothetical protein